MVMLADKLTLDDNTTCQLVRSSYQNINFYSVNIEDLARGSPLGIKVLYLLFTFILYYQSHSFMMHHTKKVMMPLCISLMLSEFC